MLLPFRFIYELCEFDFELFNADKKVSSLDQFLTYMNEEDLFDSFPGIGNVIASDVVRKDVKAANVFVSYYHYESYKKEVLGDLGEARSIYTQTNALTGKSCTTAVHRGNLIFMVLELIIEELSAASVGIDESKTVGA